jgi:hypothetical protein
VLRFQLSIIALPGVPESDRNSGIVGDKVEPEGSVVQVLEGL